jgi:hypothetical protein
VLAGYIVSVILFYAFPFIMILISCLLPNNTTHRITFGGSGQKGNMKRADKQLPKNTVIHSTLIQK